MGAEFQKKTGIIINYIASDLLQYRKDQKMPSISEYQEAYSVSRGTIQNAINYLKKEGAITCESKGHLGTYIQDIDYFILQQYAISETILGTMTLPYSLLYEGLASGLYSAFADNDIKLNLAYIRGSKERIWSVKNKTYRFAVVSRFAAKKAIEKGEPLDIIVDFGNSTYLSKHVLLFSNENAQVVDGMRIGIDYESLDQQLLTQEIVGGHEVKLVEMPGHQIIPSLNNGVIDIGIWNYDELRDKNYPNIYFADIETEYAMDMSASVIISHVEDVAIRAIFQNSINVDKVLKIQTEVSTGKMIPSY